MKRYSLLLLAGLGALAGCIDTTTPNQGSVVILDCTGPALTYVGDDYKYTTTASGLKYLDVTVGTGATFAANTTVGVRYAGCLTNGARFDSNETASGPLTFKLGAGGVIKGFDEGLTGMKVGGRRYIVIPPALAYGNTGNGPIPPNSTLVFTVDAVSAQ